MKKPYFLEKTMPSAVQEYMDNHVIVDLDLMTQHLLDNCYELRHKKFHALRRSVKSAYEWNRHLARQREKVAGATVGTTAADDATAQPQPSEQTENESQAEESFTNKRLEAQIESSILSRRRKSELVSLMPKAEATQIPLQELRGLDAVIQEVHLVLAAVGRGGPQSLLVSGADRCGKTTLVMAMAQGLGLEVVVVSLEEVMLTGTGSGGGAGTPAKRLQEQLGQAHAKMPCVILLCQVERLCSGRDVDSGRSSGGGLRVAEQRAATRVVVDYLAGLRGRGREGGPALVVGETSAPELLHWTLSHSFTRRLHIPPPNAAHRCHILQWLCRPLGIAETVLAEDHAEEQGGEQEEINLSMVALKASGFVAGDLVNLVEEGEKTAMDRANRESVDVSLPSVEFLEALGQLQPLPPVHVTPQDLLDSIKKVLPCLKQEGFPTIPDTTWADVGGLNEVRRKLRDKIIQPMKHPEQAANFGFQQASGILLWGPPGCGKTLLAKAVANEAGINLVTVSGPELLSMYQGESERAVREVFARAAAVAPCVIFFDEFDSLCPHRARGAESGSKSTIVNTLLTEMNGFLERPGIFLMAATNLPSVLDPAVLRPGRFDTQLYVGLPDQPGRVAVLNAATRHGTRPRLASDVCIDDVARRCDNFSGADCHNVIATAVQAAITELNSRPSAATNALVTSPERVTAPATGSKRPRESDHNENMKRQKIHAINNCNDVPNKNGVDSNRCDDTVTSTEHDADLFPEGYHLLYARHFDAAFIEVKPSVSAKEARKYIQQMTTKSFD